jgi:hypothetical protein
LGSHLVWRARQEPSSWLAFVDEVIARIAVGVRVFERSRGRRIRLERIGQGQSGELTYLRWESSTSGGCSRPPRTRARVSDRSKSSRDRKRERMTTLTFPGESAEYRAARDRLLEREIELRREMEAVAAARRELPPGGVVPEDYVFQGKAADGNPADVRMSELFAPGKDSLVIYNFMFPRAYGGDRPGPTSGETALLPLEEGPCPSCVALLDQLDGAAEHASQQINVAVVAKTPLSRLLTWGEDATAEPSATSGGRSSPSRRPIRGRITAASAPSSRFGTCSTSPARGALTGMSS